MPKDNFDIFLGISDRFPDRTKGRGMRDGYDIVQFELFAKCLGISYVANDERTPFYEIGVPVERLS